MSNNGFEEVGPVGSNGDDALGLPEIEREGDTVIATDSGMAIIVCPGMVFRTIAFLDRVYELVVPTGSDDKTPPSFIRMLNVGLVLALGTDASPGLNASKEEAKEESDEVDGDERVDSVESPPNDDNIPLHVPLQMVFDRRVSPFVPSSFWKNTDKKEQSQIIAHYRGIKETMAELERLGSMPAVAQANELSSDFGSEPAENENEEATETGDGLVEQNLRDTLDMHVSKINRILGRRNRTMVGPATVQQLLDKIEAQGLQIDIGRIKQVTFNLLRLVAPAAPTPSVAAPALSSAGKKPPQIAGVRPAPKSAEAV